MCLVLALGSGVVDRCPNGSCGQQTFVQSEIPQRGSPSPFRPSLRCTATSVLPRSSPRAQMQLWDDPASAKRLHRLHRLHTPAAALLHCHALPCLHAPTIYAKSATGHASSCASGRCMGARDMLIAKSRATHGTRPNHHLLSRRIVRGVSAYLLQLTLSKIQVLA